MKVAQTELNETEYQLLARYAQEHKLTVKEALRLAARRLVLDGKVNPEDAIFTRMLVGPKTGVKNRGSEEHDEILYGER